MEEFVGAFLIFAIAVAGMAIGYIVRRKTLKGTCGGLANLRDENGSPLCEACTNPSPECRGEDLSRSGTPANEPRENRRQSTSVSSNT